MTGRILRLVLALLIAAAPLAACGKRGSPGLPAGEKSTYPKPYPAAAPEQNSTPSAPGVIPDQGFAPPPANPLVPDDESHPLPAPNAQPKP
jgi:predicted small lipoprotein YifL